MIGLTRLEPIGPHWSRAAAVPTTSRYTEGEVLRWVLAYLSDEIKLDRLPHRVCPLYTAVLPLPREESARLSSVFPSPGPVGPTAKI